MSAKEQAGSTPISPGSPLARALDGYAAPGLSPGFAERVLAAAEARPSAALAPLPPLRRPPRVGRGWRLGKSIAVGIISFGALATAAAATGMLERFDIPVPSARTVWASITGTAPVAAGAAAVPVVAAAPSAAAEAGTAPAGGIAIIGPVDTPEELAEAFRRIEDVRQGRFAARSARIDQRIDSAIERRRAAGLPVPTPEQEAALRDRIADEQARRQQIAADRIAARREELERRVESGEALTREDIVRPLREDAKALERGERIERLRRMTPAQRREALRRLPPEERRALIEQYRAGAAASPLAVPPAAGPTGAPSFAPPAAPDAPASEPVDEPSPAE